MAKAVDACIGPTESMVRVRRVAAGGRRHRRGEGGDCRRRLLVADDPCLEQAYPEDLLARMSRQEEVPANAEARFEKAWKQCEKEAAAD
ncbi:hypothetical protein [Pimelobacter simplex]|uniref:hypothetical protein n=1 Tax=Nocardioides simplex TaxID=2045 RepID=UPI00214FF1FF|nr:hypothetical protein [Pimelobacter simplex]UUW91625.1 hypothetical protein M0M43_09090 [Pimelobacter simplex]